MPLFESMRFVVVISIFAASLPTVLASLLYDVAVCKLRFHCTVCMCLDDACGIDRATLDLFAGFHPVGKWFAWIVSNYRYHFNRTSLPSFE